MDSSSTSASCVGSNPTGVIFEVSFVVHACGAIPCVFWFKIFSPQRGPSFCEATPLRCAMFFVVNCVVNVCFLFWNADERFRLNESSCGRAVERVQGSCIRTDLCERLDTWLAKLSFFVRSPFRRGLFCYGARLLRSDVPSHVSSLGTWCSGITSASHAEGPGFKSQCVHIFWTFVFEQWRGACVWSAVCRRQ